MPIYEYESTDPAHACPRCGPRFEVLQNLSEAPLTRCPDCGAPVRKLISWCRGAVVETDAAHARVESRIGEHERQGRWSHAAELADKQAEKTKDSQLRSRALDNYKKAGYDAATLEKHAKTLDSDS